MTNIFNTIVYMSSIASVVALIIMIVRILLKKICPTIFSYLLWGVLLFRLITPISFSSMLSIFNWYPIPVQFESENSGISQVQQSIQGLNAEEVLIEGVTSTMGVIDYQILAGIWAVVAIGLILTCISLYCWTIYKFREAIIIHQEVLRPEVNMLLSKHKVKVYSMKELNTPIICGIFKPKIIMPTEILNLQDQSILKNVLSHELVHLGRKDHTIKLVTLIVACIHWFNPLVWISLHLAHKDMEKSCDEQAIKYASKDMRKEYAEALLSFSLPKNQLSNTIGVAFGESDMKSRVKGILKYKKPSFWVTTIGIILVLVVTVGVVTDSSKKTVEVNLESIRNTIAEKWVKLEDISEHVIQAVIVSQDPNFEKHNGVDISALFNAAIHNLKAGGVEEGGTTISEQVVKTTTLLESDYPLERKQIQMYSAIQMEKKYSKEEIMEAYLNLIYFGRGTEGIKEAAHYYFDKEADELMREEAARLVAMINAPTRYDMISKKENNDQRAQEILAQIP